VGFFLRVAARRQLRACDAGFSAGHSTLSALRVADIIRARLPGAPKNNRWFRSHFGLVAGGDRAVVWALLL
jgi:hypothetical protein